MNGSSESDAYQGDSVAGHLPGLWMLRVDGRLTCSECSYSAAPEMTLRDARSHWESHGFAPTLENDFEVRWFVQPAGTPGKTARFGSFAEFLSDTMSDSYLSARLPVPRIEVIQEWVDRGELVQGMGAAVDWGRFEVSDDAYSAAQSALVASGATAEGEDAAWVDSLFFRRVSRNAERRGTDVHHEIRRAAVLGESAWLQSRFADLDESVRAALRQRSAEARRFEFRDPFSARHS